MDFIAAYLGNNDNKGKFFDQQKGVYPNMSSWSLPPLDFQTIKANLIENEKKLKEMLEFQNRQAILKQDYAALQTELQYFNQYYMKSKLEPLQLRSIFLISAGNILTIMQEYQRNIEKGSIKFRSKLYNLIVYGIYNF